MTRLKANFRSFFRMGNHKMTPAWVWRLVLYALCRYTEHISLQERKKHPFTLVSLFHMPPSTLDRLVTHSPAYYSTQARVKKFDYKTMKAYVP